MEFSGCFVASAFLPCRGKRGPADCRGRVADRRLPGGQRNILIGCGAQRGLKGCRTQIDRLGVCVGDLDKEWEGGSSCRLGWFRLLVHLTAMHGCDHGVMLSRLTLRGCGVAIKTDQEVAGTVGVGEAVGTLVGILGVDQEDGVGGDRLQLGVVDVAVERPPVPETCGAVALTCWLMVATRAMVALEAATFASAAAAWGEPAPNRAEMLAAARVRCERRA